jgi:hypothetical protein
MDQRKDGLRSRTPSEDSGFEGRTPDRMNHQKGRPMRRKKIRIGTILVGGLLIYGKFSHLHRPVDLGLHAKPAVRVAADPKGLTPVVTMPLIDPDQARLIHGRPDLRPLRDPKPGDLPVTIRPELRKLGPGARIHIDGDRAR